MNWINKIAFGIPLSYTYSYHYIYREVIKMAFFKSKTEKTSEDKYYEEIGKFLLEGESILREFGIIDKAFLTNLRLIFKDVNLNFKDSTLEEKVFLPLSRIDSIGIKKSAKIIAGNEVIIRARGITHSMRFGKETDEIVEFTKEVSKVIL